MYQKLNLPLFTTLHGLVGYEITRLYLDKHDRDYTHFRIETNTPLVYRLAAGIKEDMPRFKDGVDYDFHIEGDINTILNKAITEVKYPNSYSVKIATEESSVTISYINPAMTFQAGLLFFGILPGRHIQYRNFPATNRTLDELLSFSQDQYHLYYESHFDHLRDTIKEKIATTLRSNIANILRNKSLPKSLILYRLFEYHETLNYQLKLKTAKRQHIQRSRLDLIRYIHQIFTTIVIDIIKDYPAFSYHDVTSHLHQVKQPLVYIDFINDLINIAIKQKSPLFQDLPLTSIIYLPLSGKEKNVNDALQYFIDSLYY